MNKVLKKLKQVKKAKIFRFVNYTAILVIVSIFALIYTIDSALYHHRVSERTSKYLSFEEKVSFMNECLFDFQCKAVSSTSCRCSEGGGDVAINWRHLGKYNDLKGGCMFFGSNNSHCSLPATCNEFRCEIEVENFRKCRTNNCLIKMAGFNADRRPCEYLSYRSKEGTPNKRTCLTRVAREKKDPKLCEELKEEDVIECKDSVNYKIAKYKANYNICQKIKNIETKEECFSDVAIQSSKEEICSLIRQNKEMHSDCLVGVFSKRAKEERNPELCRNIPNEISRNICFNNTGQYSGTADYCVANTEGYHNCLKYSGCKMQNHVPCLKLEDDYSLYSCVLHVANDCDLEIEMAIKACDSIANEKNQQKCLNSVIRNYGNPKYCNKTNSPDSCERGILDAKKLPTLSNSIRHCEKYGKPNCMDDVYFNRAIKLKDISLCKQISDKEKWSDCFLSTGARGILSSCEEIAEPEKREDCINKALVFKANSKGSPEYCKDIPEETDRIQCFNKYGSRSGTDQYCVKGSFFHECINQSACRMKSVEPCMRHEKDFSVDKCLQEVAVKCGLKFSESVEACDMVKSRKVQGECFDKISKYFLKTASCEKSSVPYLCEDSVKKEFSTYEGFHRMVNLNSQDLR